MLRNLTRQEIVFEILKSPGRIESPGAIFAPDTKELPRFTLHPNVAAAAGWVDGQIVDVPVVCIEEQGKIVRTVTRKAVVVITERVPELPPGGPLRLPPRDAGEVVSCSDRAYQVGLAGEFRRVQVKLTGKQRRQQRRQAQKGNS